jgi:uncharacterized protein (DUF2141 family)
MNFFLFTKKPILPAIVVLLGYGVLSYWLSGCAQIGMPTGGAKDTLPPGLVKAIPNNNSLNVNSGKINLWFDEYIEIQDVSNQVIVSPFQKNNPIISSNLRTVSIKLKDSLLPNTTYHIRFGNAIKDLNEGNILSDYQYTFSTGNYIDTLTISGKVLMAETGKTDSTLFVSLYKNTSDTAIRSRKPDYLTRLNGKGEFTFSHLPSGDYHIYALKDGDGNKYYNSASETFAFSDNTLRPSAGEIPNATLYAFAEKKSLPVSTVTPKADAGKKSEKKLQYAHNLVSGRQDLLKPFELTFNNGIREIKTDSLLFVDTNYKPIAGANISLDSTRRILRIRHNWKPDEPYMLILSKTSLTDSSELSLSKADTIRFQSKRTEDYGSLKLKLKNMDISRNPVLQFVEAENIKMSFPLQSSEWKNSLMPPGEYELRILFDQNNNGKWDTGNYKEKRQPEKTICLPEKLRIKANWENEKELEW